MYSLRLMANLLLSPLRQIPPAFFTHCPRNGELSHFGCWVQALFWPWKCRIRFPLILSHGCFSGLGDFFLFMHWSLLCWALEEDPLQVPSFLCWAPLLQFSMPPLSLPSLGSISLAQARMSGFATSPLLLRGLETLRTVSWVITGSSASCPVEIIVLCCLVSSIFTATFKYFVWFSWLFQAGGSVFGLCYPIWTRTKRLYCFSRGKIYRILLFS
jgi:hypothetical protein